MCWRNLARRTKTEGSAFPLQNFPKENDWQFRCEEGKATGGDLLIIICLFRRNKIQARFVQK